MRSAVYQAASFGERLGTHRALAEALAGEADVDRRVWHQAAAVIGTNEDVAAALEGTAERARQRQGLQAAATALERAAAVSATEHQRGRRLAQAAGLVLESGRAQRARDLVLQARALTRDPTLRAGMALTLGMALSSLDWEASLSGLVQDAESALEVEPELAARLFTRRARWRTPSTTGR